MAWLVVALLVVLVIAAAALLNRNDPFQSASTELGLKLTRTVPDLAPHLEGMIDGRPATIDLAGDQIRYRVYYPDLGMALRLERETTIDRTLGKLGQGDFEVGLADFDARFRVNTSRPDALRQLLTPELRRQLIGLIDRYPQVVIADGEISLLSGVLEPPADEIVTTVRDLVATAVLLDANRPPPRAETPPPPAAAPTAVHTPIESRDEEPAPEPPPEPIPSSPVNEPEPQPEPVPAATGLPPGFFDEAFGENRLSFENDDRFDSEIKGTTVTLSGVVRQAAVTEGDGTDPQTKVVVKVAQIDTSLYGKTDIDAVVLLRQQTELERGAEITFTGTADRIDPFMRSLFISDAFLVK